MLDSALLAAAEAALNHALQLDSTALPRLAALRGRVLELHCTAPQLRLFVLADAQGLRLAAHWEAADCRLSAPASALLQLLGSRDKTAILHHPDVQLQGDAQLLLALAAILQNLELDWEHALSRLLGPLPAALLGGHLRSRWRWADASRQRLQQGLAEFLSEEARTLVGDAEAQARFAELDEVKLAVERAQARLDLISRHLPKRP